MKSKKESNEKTQIVEVTGNLEDTMTEVELKQFEEDFYLDGGPGYIPTWSSCYKPKEKKYYANEFKGDYEIVSLTGTINTMNGEYYSHMHLSAGNDQGEVFGGHLNKAIVSATCEMVIQVINGQVDRYFDEEIGLNLLKL